MACARKKSGPPPDTPTPCFPSPEDLVRITGGRVISVGG